MAPIVLALLAGLGIARADVTVGGLSTSIPVEDLGAAVAVDRGGLGFDRIGSLHFVPLKGAPLMGATEAAPVAVWMRFPARPSWYVVVPTQVNRAELYVRVGGSYRATEFGMQTAYAQRSVRRVEPTAQISADVDRDSWVYLHVLMPYDGYSVQLSTAAYLQAADETERSHIVFPLIVILSICAALGFANLVLFVIARDRVFLIYAFTMVMAVLLGVASRPAIGWGLIWPNLALPVYPVAQVTLLGYLACVALFCRTFLDLPRQRPWLDRLVLGALVAYFALDIWLEWYVPANQLWGRAEQFASLVDFCYFSTILFAGIWVWRSGKTTARFFVIAFSGVLVGDAMDILAQGWMGSASILSFFGGVAWEGTMLFAALADNYNGLARAREQADAGRLELAQQRSAEIEYLALHDSLTGLPNRRAIELELSGLEESDRLAPKHALAYIDLDHFKVVNDTFGHAAGDQLLIEVAGCLRQAAPETDTVARIGGDEFLVLLRNVASAEAVTERSEQLREAIALLHVMQSDQIIHPSASIGVASARPGAADPLVLLSLADAACAIAKDGGRNRVHFVSDETSAARMRREMDWVGRITKALEDDRMLLYAQSIVPLDTLKVGERFEVLVRLLDTNEKIVAPSAFLPAAERFGLMPQIDGFVMERALALCAPAALHGDLKSLSINLSGAFLRLGNAQRMIERCIDVAGFPPERLCLEITETVVATHLGDVIGLMHALEPRGVRFALDDFGTGSSSLALLKRLRLDYLKIDGFFVRDCAENHVDRAILESIVGLTRLLEIQTVCEYVVNARTAELLRELGVDYGQGQAFDRARPIEDAIAQSRESRRRSTG